MKKLITVGILMAGLSLQAYDYNNMYDTSGNRQQDRSNGQYGGGIYGK